MGGNVFLHLLYPAAVRESLYLGKRRTGQHPSIVIEGKFVKDTEKVHHGIKALLLGSQLIQPVVHLHDGLHGETKSALCTLQHPADTVELVLVDNVPEEQVGRELNGNLPNIPGGNQNANMDSVIIEIQQKLDQLEGSFPDGAGKPMIMQIDPDMMPVRGASADVEGMTQSEISDYVENELSPVL